ncbi:MAG: DUF134 domain-containing protein [Actinomycetota bacterium]|nr:DUF134 domain-containing protein [Actinomycetota bacterium]
MSARPAINKIVNTVPLFVYYKPHGVTLEKIDEIVLTLEEIETLNLKDRQGLDQKDAARFMGISRSTFQRLLKSARKKIITAIVEGKALRFEGGNYISDKDIIKTKCLKGTYHYRIKKEDLDEKTQEYRLSKIKCPQCGKRLVTFK